MNFLERLRAAIRVAPATPSSRIVVIGVDFGTSGTKLAFRDYTEKGRIPNVVDFGTTLRGFSRFAYPSAVAFDGDRIFTGTQAYEGGYSTLLRAPKVQLLRESRETNVPLPAFLNDATDLELNPAPVPAEFAASVLIANLLRAGRKILEKHYHDLARVRLLYNIDVPVNELEDEATARRFKRTLEAGILMSVESEALNDRPKARDAWLRALDQISKTAVNGDDSNTNVVGEAQAVMAGIGEALATDMDQPHAVVDVGAGTTDIGIFRFVDWKDQKLISFFAAGMVEAGCNDVDGLLARAIGADCDDLILNQVSAAKPALSAGRCVELDCRSGQVLLTPEHLEQAVDSVSSKCYERYEELWGAAYAKEPNSERWRTLRVLLVGGGSLLPGFADRFGRLATRMRNVVGSVQLAKLDDRLDCRVVGESGREPEPNEIPFLIPVLGLAHAIPDLRELVRPIDVEPVEPPGRAQTGVFDFEADDLYSK